MLNLPPWLCKKQKYIMMLGLILGAQQPGNDIDTYFSHLVEDLDELWYNDGVQVWDEHKREYIDHKAILFVLVSDSSAAHNLSGQQESRLQMSTLFQRNIIHYLSESQKSVHGTSMLHFNETPVLEYEG
jgi:hypothetical protein